MEMETPTISNVVYGTSTNTINPDAYYVDNVTGYALERRIAAAPATIISPFNLDMHQEDESMSDTKRRLVKIFIADPDEDVPVEECMLYSGEEILTELTDQELFFEIPMKKLLDSHNEIRVKIEKETKIAGVEYLKKARIRDLCMTVVTIAEF